MTCAAQCAADNSVDCQGIIYQKSDEFCTLGKYVESVGPIQDGEQDLMTVLMHGENDIKKEMYYMITTLIQM